MRMRNIGVLAATIAAAATLVPAATAGQTFSSDVDVVEAGTLSNNRYGLFGEVISQRRRCETNRVVKLLISPNASGPLNVVDSDRTSAHGVFGLSFDTDKDLERIRIKAARKHLSPSKTCVAASQAVDL